MFHRIAAVLLCIFAFISYSTAFSVAGNTILDPTGKTIMLRGVDRCSFEWNPNGEQASAHDYQLMANWGANVVRIAMNQDFWLAGASTYSSNYASNIDQQVQWAKAAGMGVILDLHWSDLGNLHISTGANQQNMADTNSITFWTQVATKYKSDPYVIFELYNEPHDVSWDNWRNGGSGWAGMQQLYNAVRATGAANMVIVNGLNWAFDLSGISSYAITGTNIAYGTHPYDYPGKQSGNWDAAFGYLASHYPVVMTEFGEYCSADGYVAALLAYAQTKGIHWTAWAWYVSDCEFPSIISDWSGTPTAVGQIVKQYLAGTSTIAPVTYTPLPTTPASAGSSGSSGNTAPSTSGTVTPATGSEVVYGSSLNSNWVDYSWGTVSKGTSISLQLSSYGAIYLHRTSSFAAGSYASLQFSINSQVQYPSLTIQLYDAESPNPMATGLALQLPAALVVGQWVTQTIPISSFGLSASTQITGFALKWTLPSVTSNYIYVSQVAFVPASQAATAAPTTQPATAAPTVAATAAPTTKPGTSAPTNRPSQTATPVTFPGTGAADCSTVCDGTCVQLSQQLSTSWQDGQGNTIYQYGVSINNLCTTKTLAGFTLTATHWDPTGYWNVQVISNVLSVSNAGIAPGATFTEFGYQNEGQEATFTLTTFTFQ